MTEPGDPDHPAGIAYPRPPKLETTELGDRLRSMAHLADEHPEWTGVIVLAHLDTVTMHMSCTDENGDLGAQVLTAGLSAMVGPGMMTRESPFAERE